jgi:hypothetical protein
MVACAYRIRVPFHFDKRNDCFVLCQSGIQGFWGLAPGVRLDGHWCGPRSNVCIKENITLLSRQIGARAGVVVSFLCRVYCKPGE